MIPEHRASYQEGPTILASFPGVRHRDRRSQFRLTGDHVLVVVLETVDARSSRALEMWVNEIKRREIARVVEELSTRERS